MAIDLATLETAIRNAIPIIHLSVEDQSSGCGESYSIVIVSEVR
jgi:stress-induced morphogen